ncbi:hypothetical protein B0H17DRAFT_1218565 [Mycena rosella]|uniref:Uncharacterized protein n=1 Tax=Mycena rosella TaxID=1033263 RepID=A0AAD7FM03_MYCRO|nr:hypothetical protein B0H17DRAFT_1218565 [Mycena rosella]
MKSLKKVKIEDEKILEMSNVLNIKVLPSECEVSDKSIQDEALQDIYDTLPCLRKVNVTSWSSAQGPGNILLSSWDLYNSVLNVDVLGMVFHQRNSHAQINTDAIKFGTKIVPSTASGFNKVEAKLKNGVRSLSTHVGRSRSVTSEDVLSADDKVPIFDGRTIVVDFTADIDNIAKILPRYESVDDEIPNGACVGVAYTVSKFTTRDGKESVGFNIKWVVVFGEPGDDE